MDREYAISFIAGSGLDEVNSGVTTLAAAKKVARGYYKDGASQVVIKFYEDGDIRHQWDFDGKKFVQYE